MYVWPFPFASKLRVFACFEVSARDRSIDRTTPCYENPSLAFLHHVGVHGLSRAGEDLDGLVGARRGDDRVRARHRRDDVLHHPEGQLVRDPGDAVRLGPVLRLLAHPLQEQGQQPTRGTGWRIGSRKKEKSGGWGGESTGFSPVARKLSKNHGWRGEKKPRYDENGGGGKLGYGSP